MGLVLRARLLVGESLGPAVDEVEARVARLQQEEAGAELPRARGGAPLRLVVRVDLAALARRGAGIAARYRFMYETATRRRAA